MRFCVLVCAVLATLISANLAAENPSLRSLAEEAYVRWLARGTATPEEKALMEALMWPPERAGTLDGISGPDSFGYRWIDNRDGDTVQFAWIELCGDSLAQFGPTGDDQTGLISWSFPFPFYGVSYTSSYVSINGKLTFVSGDGAWSNRCLTVDATQPTINVHWDDLVAQQTEDCGSGTPRIKYRDFGDYLVIEWSNVWHYPLLDERFTFEVILFSSGLIKMQYASLDCWGYCNTSTVSIDVPGTDGVEYVCNGAPSGNELLPGRAVCFFAIPRGPQALVIRPDILDAVLHWRSETNAISYSVFRSVLPGVQPSPANLIATVSDTTYTDAGVLSAPEMSHFYLVTANR